MNNLNNLENNLDQPAETNPENSNQLLGAVTKCLTFAPLILEQFTGQKVPQMTGTIAEINLALSQIQVNLQTVV